MDKMPLGEALAKVGLPLAVPFLCMMYWDSKPVHALRVLLKVDEPGMHDRPINPRY